MCAFGADTDDWQAGVARSAITPTAPLWMTGYAVRDHPAEGRAQELWVKALALQDAAGHRAIVITADLCGITRALSDRVAGELEKKFSLPRSAVLVNASHTHCSPSIDGYLTGLRDYSDADRAAIAAYTLKVSDQMIATATAAIAGAQPARLYASRDHATFALNRRNNSEKEALARLAAGKLVGPVDYDVPVLGVRDRAGKLLAVLVSYACHNTTLSFYQWHGDYAGCALQDLEERHSGAIALFAQGCAGNINPFPRGSIGIAEQHGRELADAVDRALAAPGAALSGTFASALTDVPLEFAQRPSAEEIRAAAASTKPAASRQMDQAWSKIMVTQAAQGGITLTYPYPVQTWRLGNLTWVALGGEAVVDYALRLKGELGKNLWVLAYSNDVMAYIPSEAVLKEGGYEGKTSMIPYGRPSAWAPGLEEKITAQVRRSVAELTAAR